MLKTFKSKLRLKIKSNKYMYKIYRHTFGALIENYRIKERTRIVQENGLASILEIEEKLEKKKVCYFVDNGTLLGCIREKKILKWDYDIDFGIFINEDFTWFDLENIMKQIGYKKKHQFKYKNIVTEQTYEKNGLVVDFFNHFSREHFTEFFVYYKKDDYRYEEETQFHVLVLKTVKLSGTFVWHIDGGSVHVPNEYEAYLAGLYGETWRIPNPNWVSGSGPACEAIEGIFGYYEEFKSV